MKQTVKNISSKELVSQVRLDFQTEQDTSTIVIGRYNALVDAGSEDPAAEVMKELLETTSKLTRNKKPSWAKIAAYAFLGGWTWDEFNAAMKEAVKLWRPKWDSRKRSSMQGCWGTYRYDKDLWNEEKKSSGKKKSALKKAALKMEAALAALEELTATDRKSKEFAEIEAYNRLIYRKVTGTVILND